MILPMAGAVLPPVLSPHHGFDFQTGIRTLPHPSEKEPTRKPLVGLWWVGRFFRSGISRWTLRGTPVPPTRAASG
jgi:hypothetical protein